MSSRTISSNLILPLRKLVPIIVILSGLVSSCGTAPSQAPIADTAQTPQTTAADELSPTPQVIESTPVPTSETVPLEQSSSEQLGLCFSYPQGYTQGGTTEQVSILPGSILKGMFWIEISDAYDRSAELIADQELTWAAGMEVGRWTLTLDGEEAVVLDGMPGQELQRRVYVVHEGTLYILAFWPALSPDQTASDQMEDLYDAVTSSWSWSPCSAGN